MGIFNPYAFVTLWPCIRKISFVEESFISSIHEGRVDGNGVQRIRAQISGNSRIKELR